MKQRKCDKMPWKIWKWWRNSQETSLKSMFDPSMSTDPTQTAVFLHHFLSLLIYASSNNQPANINISTVTTFVGLWKTHNMSTSDRVFDGFWWIQNITKPSLNQTSQSTIHHDTIRDGKTQLPLEPPLGSWRPAECPASRFGRRNRSAAAWQRWPGRRCRWCLPLATDGSHLSVAGQIGQKTWGNRWKIYGQSFVFVSGSTSHQPPGFIKIEPQSWPRCDIRVTMGDGPVTWSQSCVASGIFVENDGKNI